MKRKHPNTNVQLSTMTSPTKRTSKYIRRSHKRMIKVYSQQECSSSSCETDACENSLKKRNDPSRVPVFRLPKSHRLSSIPEDAEVQWGFFIRLQQEEGRKEEDRQTHCKGSHKKSTSKRRFSGLMSLSNPNKQFIERSAATDIEFRSYSTSKFPIGAKAA